MFAVVFLNGTNLLVIVVPSAKHDDKQIYRQDTVLRN